MPLNTTSCTVAVEEGIAAGPAVGVSVVVVAVETKKNGRTCSSNEHQDAGDVLLLGDGHGIRQQ